jgi:putative ABC transport system permease protein
MRLSAIAWRGLVARPLRTALTAAGIALGVAVVVATLIANQASAEAVERAARELYGAADLRVRAFASEGFTPRTVAALRRLPGVVAAAPLSERRLTLSTEPGPDEAVFTMLVFGVDPEAEAQVRPQELVAGEPLSAPDAAEVLVPASFAADEGLSVGDTLLLIGRREGVPPLRITGLLPDTGFGALSQGAVAVMGRETLDTAFDAAAPIRNVDLDIEPGSEAQVEAALDASMTEPFVVETVADAQAQIGRAQGGFVGLAFLFGIIALLVGAFLVANTMSMTLRERMREIGLLRAAGMTARQGMALFGRQAVVIGLIGSVGGVLAGIVLAAVLIGFLRATRSVLAEGLPISLPIVLLAIMLGMGVTLAGALIPAVAASRISPLDALRPSRLAGEAIGNRVRWLLAVEVVVVGIALLLYPVDRGSVPILSLLLGIILLLGGAVLVALLLDPLSRIIGRPFELFFGAQGMLGRANLGRDRSRTGLTVGALVIALATVVALGTVAGSARATADRWVDSILPGGYAIRAPLALDIDTFRGTFEATSGTRIASPIIELPLVLSRDDAQREVSVAGIDGTLFQDEGALIVTSGRRAAAFEALRVGGSVLVPEAVARRDGISVGDVLPLGEPGRDAVPFTVAGIVAYSLPGRTGDGALLISATDARDLLGASSAALWAMIPQAGITDAAYASAVAQTAQQLAGEALTAPQLAADLSRSLDRLVGLFDVLALIAVIIAALGIVNALAMGVIERLREIAILRAHGMTASGVQAMIVTEGAIMGAVAGLAAAIIGIVVALAVVSTGAGDFAAGLVVPWALLLAVVLLGIGVAAGAAIYPARLAARTPLSSSIGGFE